MKHETISNDQVKAPCGTSACLNCAYCEAVNYEERRSEVKTSPLQLYAKELESYFFHYALAIKKNN